MPDPSPATSPRPPSARRIVVALDGPASSGKSSVGAAAAARLGLRFVDTGLIYRAMTAIALRAGAALDDAAALVPLAGRVRLDDDGSGRLTRVLLDGEDATDAVRSDAVDGAVSAVARVPEVRAALLERQRAIAAEGGIIVVGRDIGTVVLPGCAAQDLPRRVGGGARVAPDRGAWPGPRRRGGRDRPPPAAAARRAGSATAPSRRSGPQTMPSTCPTTARSPRPSMRVVAVIRATEEGRAA